jgi:pentapeptide MXKDX repeat protein
MLCCAMLCYAMLCCAVLCCAMLCYAMLCYAMLCYARTAGTARAARPPTTTSRRRSAPCCRRSIAYAAGPHATPHPGRRSRIWYEVVCCATMLQAYSEHRVATFLTAAAAAYDVAVVSGPDIAYHMRCDAMRCDAMRCDAMRCDAMRCDAMRCDAMLGPDLYFNQPPYAQREPSPRSPGGARAAAQES